MRQSRPFPFLFGLILAVFLPHAAWAQSGSAYETFVSRTGTDAGSCISTTTPCASINYALTQTTPGGQINVIDAGDYGPFVIAHSVSIVADGAGSASPCCGGAGGFSIGGGGPTGNALIIINAGPSDSVTLRGLTIHGPTVLTSVIGIAVISGGRVSIEKTKVVDTTGLGIAVYAASGGMTAIIDETSVTGSPGGLKIAAPGGSVNASISRSAFSANTGGGIRIDGTNGGTITASISDTVSSGNTGNGMVAISGPGNVAVNITRSVFASNSSSGVQSNSTSGGTSAVTLRASTVTNNAAGQVNFFGGGATLRTFGDNNIVGTSGTGFTGPVALQ